ncbi:hypothetical protein JTB14_003606 [Gonioctena quinquepunctata]|nr:hypothetical protein JTB14_003606 [Gonioctena quinquepunctata]
MTEDELYAEIDMTENDCVPIPSDRDPDNDSKAESISKGTAADVPADIFDNPDGGEIVVSDYAEDELLFSGESDAEDTVPLFTLAKRLKNNLCRSNTWYIVAKPEV